MADAQPADSAARWQARLDEVERRLVELGGGEALGGQTAPDEKTGERWQETQVWGHLTEFPGYWTGEIRRIITARRGTTPEFGRPTGDADRVAAIEAGRNESREALVLRATNAVADAKAFLLKLDPAAWELRGRHIARGEMPVSEIVERFVVGHLEEHADQLESLSSAGSSSHASPSSRTRGT